MTMAFEEVGVLDARIGKLMEAIDFSESNDPLLKEAFDLLLDIRQNLPSMAPANGKPRSFRHGVRYFANGEAE